MDTGLARYEWRHAQFNAGSEQAALATECAADQGAFWEFHHAALTDPERAIFEDGGPLALAREHQLDLSVYSACLADAQHLPAIQQSLSDAFRNAASPDGYLRTPAFIVNGEFIGRDYDSIVDRVYAAVGELISGQN